MNLLIFISFLTAYFINILVSGDEIVPYQSLRKTTTEQLETKDTLIPVFLFHGLFVSPQESYGKWNELNLEAHGLLIYPLGFCSGACTFLPLEQQIHMAINAVQKIIANDPEIFKDGYYFVGHSLGTIISRGVIELWNEHHVIKYISLAGPQNGIFLGKNERKVTETTYLPNISLFVPGFTIPEGDEAIYEYFSGEAQVDITKLLWNSFSHRTAFVDLWHPPLAEYSTVSSYLTILNNLQDCPEDENYEDCEVQKIERKKNFLRIKKVYLFGSEQDTFIAPTASMTFQEYEITSNLKDDLEKLEILPLELTKVYHTIGLDELMEEGRLRIKTPKNVPHDCWVRDDQGCEFLPMFNDFILPALQEKI